MMGMRAGERPEEDADAIEQAAARARRARDRRRRRSDQHARRGRRARAPRHRRHRFPRGVRPRRERAHSPRSPARRRARRARPDLAEPGARLRARAAHRLHDPPGRRPRRPRGARGAACARPSTSPSTPRSGPFSLDGTRPVRRLAEEAHLPIDAFPVPHKGPVDVAADLGLLAPDVLLVHLTDVRAESSTRRRSGRAGRALPALEPLHRGQAAAAARDAEAGIVPALGTDSLASNPSLDVLAEARALADRFPSVPKGVCRMATRPARARSGRDDLGASRRAAPRGPGHRGRARPKDDPCACACASRARAPKWIARAGRSRERNRAS